MTLPMAQIDKNKKHLLYKRSEYRDHSVLKKNVIMQAVFTKTCHDHPSLKKKTCHAALI
jgi:hypothetical protein